MTAGRKPQSVEIAEAIAADQGRTAWYKASQSLFNPSLPDMRGPDAPGAYILDGRAPSDPPIGAGSRVTFVGACYGGMLATHLKSLSLGPSGATVGSANFIPINESLSTSFAMRQIFEWALEGVKPDPGALKGNRALDINYSDELWGGALDLLRQTDVFVLLLSSAEIWQDQPTGAVLWREVPGANPSRQVFRMSTVEENRANLLTIHDLVRRHRPDAKLIWVLSPIPMVATHRTDSCIRVNTVSKAVLNVAIDEVERETAAEGRSFYWPFYDVVLEAFGATPYGGHFNGDRRHINDAVLDYMMLQFETFYCQVDTPSRPLFEAYVRARVDTLDLPAALIEAADSADRRALQQMIDHYERIDDLPTARLVERYASLRLGLPIPEAQDAVWTPTDVAWQTLPSLEWAGPAPQVLAIPGEAWGYGAASAPFHAHDGADLLLRVRVRAVDVDVGVMLIRHDGSALSDKDQCVPAGDSPVTVELRVYPEDGRAHILFRNFDCDGVAGSVEVLEVATRWSAPVCPSVNAASA